MRKGVVTWAVAPDPRREQLGFNIVNPETLKHKDYAHMKWYDCVTYMMVI